MPNLLLAFMAIFIVSCASHSTNNMKKASVQSESYFFDAMTSTRR